MRRVLEQLFDQSEEAGRDAGDQQAGREGEVVWRGRVSGERVCVSRFGDLGLLRGGLEFKFGHFDVRTVLDKER